MTAWREGAGEWTWRGLGLGGLGLGGLGLGGLGLGGLGLGVLGWLAPDGMAAAQQWLVRTWDTALAAYAAEVSRRRREPSAPHPESSAPRSRP
jgi:hypothetical protein